MTNENNQQMTYAEPTAGSPASVDLNFLTSKAEGTDDSLLLGATGVHFLNKGIAALEIATGHCAEGFLPDAQSRN